MKKNEEHLMMQRSPWAIFRIARWFTQKIKRGYQRLSPTPFLLPDQEAGELMRRVLANKSWFDKLSSGWVAQPFLVKVTTFSALFLPVIFTGMSVGMPTLVSFCAFFVFSGIHSLLVSHERHRREKAGLFAAEAIALNNDLKASQAVLDEAVGAVRSVASALNNHYLTAKKNAQLIIEDTKELREGKATFSRCVDLLSQEAVVKQGLQQVCEDMNTLDDGITQTTKSLHAVDKAAESFNESVVALKNSQQAYSDSVKRFGLFLDEQERQSQLISKSKLPMPSPFPLPVLTVSDDEESEDHAAFLAETDRLIAEIKARNEDEQKRVNLIH